MFSAQIHSRFSRALDELSPHFSSSSSSRWSNENDDEVLCGGTTTEMNNSCSVWGSGRLASVDEVFAGLSCPKVVTQWKLIKFLPFRPPNRAPPHANIRPLALMTIDEKWDWKEEEKESSELPLLLSSAASKDVGSPLFRVSMPLRRLCCRDQSSRRKERMREKFRIFFIFSVNAIRSKLSSNRVKVRLLRPRRHAVRSNKWNCHTNARERKIVWQFKAR